MDQTAPPGACDAGSDRPGGMAGNEHIRSACECPITGPWSFLHSVLGRGPGSFLLLLLVILLGAGLGVLYILGACCGGVSTWILALSAIILLLVIGVSILFVIFKSIATGIRASRSDPDDTSVMPRHCDSAPFARDADDRRAA